MDALALLRLQIEWGADEALTPDPIDRRRGRTPDAPAVHVAAPLPVQSPSPPPAGRAGLDIPAGRAGLGVGGGQVAAARAAAGAAFDLPSLRAAVAAFDGCSLRETATNLVFAEGSAAAGVAIVGDVPDAEEDRAGHPFAGRPGLLLDHMLASIALDRARVLLMPLIPWRPPGGSRPSDFHLAVCRPFLERALVLTQPQHMLLMGANAARLLADVTFRARGWQAVTVEGLSPDARALAMRHPSYLLSHLPARRDAWIDLLRLRRRLGVPARPITGA